MPIIHLRDHALLYKEKKQIRQKSKYLGKNVNGIPVKVRSKDQVTKRVLLHGESVSLLKINEDLNSEQVLSGVPPSRSSKKTATKKL